MESPIPANQCAIDRLLLESVLSGGTLEAGTIRVCEIAGCTGAAVLRPSTRIEGANIPVFANPDGTTREDYCPRKAALMTEMDEGEARLLRALRDRKDPNA
jgi:hypothetical protein